MSCSSGCCSHCRPSACIFTANSKIGSACIKEIFRRYSWYIDVRGVFRTEEKAKQLREEYPAMDIVTGVDASKPETLAKAFKGVKFCLIVQPNGSKNENDADVNNSQLSLNMINAAVENGINYIVYVSSFAVKEPQKLSIIASRFQAAESLLKKLNEEKDIRYTILRGGIFMENFRLAFDSIRENSSFDYPNASAAYVDVRDIGKCAALCLASKGHDHNRKIYEMNGSQVLRPEDIAGIFSKVLGREIKWNELKEFSGVPSAIAQIYEYLTTVEKDKLPTQNDIKTLIGPNNTFDLFVKEHKIQLQND